MRQKIIIDLRITKHDPFRPFRNDYAGLRGRRSGLHLAWDSYLEGRSRFAFVGNQQLWRSNEENRGNRGCGRHTWNSPVLHDRLLGGRIIGSRPRLNHA